MCGIFGIFDFSGRPILPGLLKKMGTQIIHRGPDNFSIQTDLDNTLGIGHCRLAIVDLSKSANQPMTNKTRDITLAFNGMIYNYKELRNELIVKGYQFRTNCDTEVILNGFEEYGEGILSRLDGMFALAIWQQKTRTLLLARDRMGKKPLYFFKGNRQFIFASEMKAILVSPNVQKKMNLHASFDFLTLGYVPAPTTMIKNVYKLQAGAYLTVSSTGEIHESSLWKDYRSPSISKLSYREHVSLTREKVKLAVTKRLVSDVPIGSFLSGGMDSSVVTGILARNLGNNLRTFSLGFKGETVSDKVNWDMHQAKKTANYFGTKHHEVILDTDDKNLPDIMDKYIWHMDEPFANPTILSSFLLAECAKQEGVKVILTGDGGDEIFLGYDRYRYDYLLSQLQYLPLGLRLAGAQLFTKFTKLNSRAKYVERALRKSCNMPSDITDRYLFWRALLDQKQMHEILTPEMYQSYLNYHHPQNIREFMKQNLNKNMIENLAFTDLRLWVPDENNMRLDKSLMSASIEGRAPFLDIELANFFMSLPASHRMNLFSSKKLLRDAFPEYLANNSSFSKKRGFFTPAGKWLNGVFHKNFSESISESTLANEGMFKISGIEFLKNSKRSSKKLWMIYILHQWKKIYQIEL